MESESYSQLLQKLADAMRRCSDWLPGDRDAAENGYPTADADFEFHELVDTELLDVLAALGADRRTYLAELIDSALNRAVEAGVEFVAACDGMTPPIGKQYWQDVAMDDIRFSDPAYPDDFGESVAGLLEALYRCDKVFVAVDAAVRQTKSSADRDSEHEAANRDLGQSSIDDPKAPGPPPVTPVYQRQFERRGYTPKELYEELGISDGSLNTYTKNAGVTPPGRGKGRSHRYSAADVVAICHYINDEVTIKEVVENAKQLLLKIENKSKTES